MARSMILCLLFMILSLQLSTNFNLTVCIFESRLDIKNLTTSSYSAPLKTPKDKIRSNSSKRCIKLKTQRHHKFFLKGLLGIPIDPFLNFFAKSRQRVFRKCILLPVSSV